MIDKGAIEDFFVKMSADDHFDMQSELRWNFYFLDGSKSKLKKLSRFLEAEGYKFIDVFEAEKENPNDVSEYYLNMQKVEYLDISALEERNRTLYALIEEKGIQFYDGFDIEAI